MLIALNLGTALGRADACTLASRLVDWCWRRSLRHTDLGVTPEALSSARGLVAGAADVAASEERAAGALGARILVRGEAEYPSALETLSHPPPAIYLRGDLPAAPGIAIVGPRNADPWALDAAAWFAGDLARRGLTVVSGFARGVDAAAHRGALATPDGRTLAVLGCGLDVPYPRQHYRLAAEIAQRGAVVTEFPIGREPAPWHFPVRNRMIAALSAATLVIQATAKSGALSTARFALDLGREVLALPGRVGDPRSAGSNALLRDGAHVALEPDDVWMALPLAARPPETAPCARERRSSEPILDLLVRAPLPVDELATRLDLPVERVLAKLSELELRGQVERLPGATWGRSRG